MSRQLILLLALAGALAMASGSQAQSRPNLVFLLTDDQRADAMGCAGHPILKTPQMDRLAREGVRFTNAFVTTPICAASRASLFTGLWERTHRFTFSTPPIRNEHVDLSYPTRLRAAGYRTGFTGKFGVRVPAGAEGRMWDYYEPLNRTPYLKPQPDGSVRHLTDITADSAIRFIEGCEPGRPFSLSVSFNAPHAEDNDPQQYFWPESVDHLYRDAKIEPPRTMTEEFFRKQQPFLHDSESRVRFRWRFDEPAKYRRMVAGYYRMISGVDAAIGRIRESLERKGVAKNTIIIFSSDNGYFLGERGFADKWYGYEHSLRVPLIVLDPRLPAGRRGSVAPSIALNTDVAPTLLDLAGIQVPGEMQGSSLVPLLSGQVPPEWRTDFFFEHLFERHNIPKSEGVRDGRFTYIRWFEHGAEELYDHQADPEQERNLAGERPHQKDLLRLRRRTDELRDQYGGPYQRPAAGR